MRAQYVFVAQKTDGFGARCLALVNAMLLADFFDGAFAFRWEGRIRDGYFHSVQVAEDVFSRKFLDEHSISKKLPSIAVLRESDFLRLADLGLESETGKIFIEAPSRLPAGLLRLTEKELFAKQAEAFGKIGFHPKLEAVGRRARGFAPSKATSALHLRAGDVVYGNVKFCSQTEIPRGVPYTLAHRFIVDAAEKQQDVLLFGQDAELCRALASFEHVTFVEDLIDSAWSMMEREYFEIQLMSQCAEAVGAHSAFLELASFVAGVPLVNIYDRYSRADLLAITSATAAAQEIEGGVSVEQKVFNHWMAILFLLEEEDLDLERLADLATEMLEFDKTNGFIMVIVMSALYGAGKMDAVRRLLKQNTGAHLGDARFPPLRAVFARRLTVLCSQRLELDRVRVLLLYLLAGAHDVDDGRARRLAQNLDTDPRPGVTLLCAAVRKRRQWLLQKERKGARYLTVGAADGEQE